MNGSGASGNRMAVLTVTILLLLLPTLSAAERIERTLIADPDGEVRIRNFSGTIRVEGWDRPEVQLLAEIGDDQALEVSERPGRILVTVRERPAVSRADLSLRVPVESLVRVTSVSADVTVTGVTGELDLRTVGGRIDAGGFGSILRARTVNGDLELDGSSVTGRVEVATVNGHARLAGAAGRLDASTVNGGLWISGGRFNSVRLNAVSGDIVGQINLSEAGYLEADNVSGGVMLQLPPDLDARFDLQSFSGAIADCDDSRAERVSRYGPGYQLYHTRGAGTATVRVKTMSGSIDVCGPLNSR